MRKPPVPRPIQVTVAAYMMMLGIPVLGAIGVLVANLATFSIEDRIGALRGRPQLTSAESDLLAALPLNHSNSYALLILPVIIAALGWFIFRGSRSARNMTWLLLGFGIASQISVLGSNPSADSAYQELGLANYTPDWYAPIWRAVGFTGLACYAVVIALLTLPAARRFFPSDRPERPALSGKPATTARAPKTTKRRNTPA